MATLLVFATCSGSYAQSATQHKPNATPSKQQNSEAVQNSALASGFDEGKYNLRPFLDDPRNANFLLKTSWIPGSDHKGVFRYKLEMKPATLTPSEAALQASSPPIQGVEIPAFVSRLHACNMFLNLYDQGGFILQKIPILFTTLVGDDSIATGLGANDGTPMDKDVYLNFIAASVSDGVRSWDIGWHC